MTGRPPFRLAFLDPCYRRVLGFIKVLCSKVRAFMCVVIAVSVVDVGDGRREEGSLI